MICQFTLFMACDLVYLLVKCSHEWGSPELKNQGGAASDTVTVHDTGLVLVALSTCFYFADVHRETGVRAGRPPPVLKGPSNVWNV